MIHISTAGNSTGVKASQASCFTRLVLFVCHTQTQTVCQCSLKFLFSTTFPNNKREERWCGRLFHPVREVARRMTDLSRRSGSPELALVAEWTVHCFQHKLLATKVPEWITSFVCKCEKSSQRLFTRQRSHTLLQHSFLLWVFIVSSDKSGQCVYVCVCGEKDDPNCVPCLVALLTCPQNSSK